LLDRIRAVIEFAQALIRELCASIAPGLDPDAFLEMFVNAPEDVVEMLVAAYLREFAANSPLHERQRQWRPTAKAVSNRVFVVHGHDHAIRDHVATKLRDAGYIPVILQREFNHGQAVIEKLEREANCFFAVILLTADDYGGLRSDKFQLPEVRESRARQNVIFELGWFMALLGRERICCVVTDDLIKLPTDISGILYYKVDNLEDVVKEIVEQASA
jgi:predicted nucleotide-binding protein